jgi:hypothetical protein
MDTTTIISDYLENSNINNFEALFIMFNDYKYQILIQELNSEVNIGLNINNLENDLPF